MERFIYTFGATGLLTIVMFPLANIVNFVVTTWSLFLIWLSSGELLFSLPRWVSSELNFLISTSLIQLISVYYIVSIPLYCIVYVYHKKANIINWHVVFFLPYSLIAMIVFFVGGDTLYDRVWGAVCLLLAACASFYRFRRYWLPKLLRERQS
jgi:hypothetical protein